jgi:hypothetical protein
MYTFVVNSRNTAQAYAIDGQQIETKNVPGSSQATCNGQDNGTYNYCNKEYEFTYIDMNQTFTFAVPSNASLIASATGFNTGNVYWNVNMANESCHGCLYNSSVNNGVFPSGTVGYATVGQNLGTDSSSGNSYSNEYQWMDCGHDQSNKTGNPQYSSPPYIPCATHLNSGSNTFSGCDTNTTGLGATGSTGATYVQWRDAVYWLVLTNHTDFTNPGAGNKVYSWSATVASGLRPYVLNYTGANLYYIPHTGMQGQYWAVFFVDPNTANPAIDAAAAHVQEANIQTNTCGAHQIEVLYTAKDRMEWSLVAPPTTLSVNDSTKTSVSNYQSFETVGGYFSSSGGTTALVFNELMDQYQYIGCPTSCVNP